MNIWIDYNMVSVAVAMVMSTIHEKSYTDLYTAQKLKQVPKFNPSHTPLVEMMVT